MQGYGKKMKQLREHYHITLEQLAQDLQISKTSICFYEQERRNPGDKVKRKYATYFNRSVQEIFFSDMNPKGAK